MNELHDIAEAITLAAPDLDPELAVEIPVDEGRWVRVLRTPEGLLLSAIRHPIGLSPEEVAARHDAAIRLGPFSRWATAVVGAVDGQGREFLSVQVDPRSTSQAIGALLERLFGQLDEDAPEDTSASAVPWDAIA